MIESDMRTVTFIIIGLIVLWIISEIIPTKKDHNDEEEE